MARFHVAAVLAVLLAVPAGLADEKKGEVKKPLGTWVREVGGNTVSFTFEADALRCVITNAGGERIVVHAPYGVAEGDTVFGLITKVEKTGGGPEKGELFSFHFQLDKDKLTLSDLKSTADREEAKQLVQGQYTRKGK
jgi:hypothetical protein